MRMKRLNKITRIVSILPDKFVVEVAFQDKAFGRIDLSEFFSDPEMGPKLSAMQRTPNRTCQI